MKRFAFGAALFAIGLLCLLHGARGQLPGTFTTALTTGGAPACTPNTQGGGNDVNVVALFHLDNNGSNGAFPPNKLPLTSLNGGAIYSTTQSKFGGYSLNIPTGGTSYAAFGPGLLISGDVTFEAWFYLPSPIGTYFSWMGDINVTFIGPSAIPQIALNVASTSASLTQTWSGGTIGVNAWHHMAWVRQGTNFLFFYDGTLIGTATGMSTATFGNTTTAWNLGRGYTATYVPPNNTYIDEVRVSNIARYTASFTAPTLPFCDPVAPVSPYAGPGDAAPGATAWWGLRAYNKAVAGSQYTTPQPLVNLRRSSDNATCDVQPAFADGSLGLTSGCSTGGNNGLTVGTFCGAACFATKLYDQSGAKQCSGAPCDVAQATVANQPALSFRCFGNFPCLSYTTSTQNLATATGPSLAQPWSVAGLARRSGAFTTQGAFYVQGTTQTKFSFPASANQVALYNGGPSTPAAAAPDGANHSLTGAWNGSSSAIVVDGANTGASLETLGNSGVFNLGPGGSSNPLTGTISEMGVWPRNLASEATALCSNEWGFAYGMACGVEPPCTTNTQGGGTIANVVALYHFDGNGDDSSGSGRNLTLVGTSSYSSAQSKFGSSSYLGGSASYATVGGSVPNISGNVTIETWIYFTSAPTTQAFGGDNGGASWNMYYGIIATGMNIAGPSNTPIRASNPTIPLNSWHHWAWVRASNVWTLYLDGVAQTMTGTSFTGNVGNGSTGWLIGTNGGGTYFMNIGYFDEWRVSNVARYTANFTPATLAFCNNS